MSSDKRVFESYRDVNVHKLMLQDVVRTEAYETALQQVVQSGQTVLDFGCGTGVLSIFAARAGAAQVHAVDRSAFISAAEAIAQTNGIDCIRFHRTEAHKLELAGQVDVIVSEWMGHFLFYECMLTPLLALRDRFLASGGQMIPAAVSLHAGLICDEEVYEDLTFLRQQPYGIDFSPIADSPLVQTELDNLLPDQIMEATVDLGRLDLQSMSRVPINYTGTVRPEREATVYGLCGWFDAELAPGVCFGTGPRDKPTHWSQAIFPLREPFAVSPEREVTISISPPEDSEQADPVWAWSIEDGTQSQLTQESYQPQAEGESGPGAPRQEPSEK